MKKLLLFLAIFTAFCSPAYAVKQKRPHTYQEKTGVYQKRKKTYTRNANPVTPEYTEEKKRRGQKKPAEESDEKQKTEKTPREIREQKKRDKQRLYNPYALPNISAAATVGRGKPKIKIEVKRKEVEFYPKEKSQLTCGVDWAAGCAHYQPDIKFIMDCQKPEVLLKVTEIVHAVEFDKAFPKGSCAFDKILKHELTHLSLYRKTLDKVLNAAANEVASVVEAMQRLGSSCSEIERTVYVLENKYENTFWKEADKQHDLIDGKEHYDYQWEQCRGKD